MGPKCGKCDNTSFEIHEVSIMGLGTRTPLVSCSNCGTTIGVMGSYDLGAKIQDIISQLNSLSQKIDQTTSNQQYTFTNKINELETELTNISYQLRVR